MYSGTTLTPSSGRVLGVHQKIDRLALISLQHASPKRYFPTKQQILHFEGFNGPDAIKRKSPAKDEPWHYYAPFDENDTEILSIIQSHYDLLVNALHAKDAIRASFEAAWLAHAIVDGMTPAHHYPYEAELTELRGGESIESRTTIKTKLVMPGETRGKQVKNNWKMWGPKGLLTTHGLFEWGIAAIIAPMTTKNARMRLTKDEIDELAEHGVVEVFKRRAKEVAAMDMYAEYYRYGWTPKLARKARTELVPTIVNMVALAWYGAQAQAKKVK